jgi:aspartate/methionine/tyrosine aminotransferase
MILPPGWTGSGLAERLLVGEGVAVVPGRFFGDDRGIRIGIGGEPALLREGLDAIGRVLRTCPPA